MTVYLVCLFSIPVYALLFYFLPVARERKNIIFSVIVGIQLVLVAVLRGESVGGDLENYIPAYKYIGETPWSDLLYIPYETGYLLLNKFLFFMTADVRLLLVVIGSFIVWGYCRYMYKSSCVLWFSMFLFITLGFFTESFSMLRQAIAMVIVLSGTKYVGQRKFFKYLGFVLLAMTFHLTAITAVLLYPLAKLKVTLLNFLVLLTICGIFIKVCGNTILDYLTTNLYGLYDSKVEAGTGISMFVLLLVVTLGGLLLQGNNRSTKKNIYHHMMIMACCMQLFAIQFSLFARIVMYFSVAMIVFIPDIICQIKDKESRFCMQIVVCVLTTLYFIVFILERNLAGIMPYRFMWQ